MTERAPTLIVRQDGDVHTWRLYETDIVSVNRKTREITLNSGGYLTATTRARMNQISEICALGFRVYTHQGIWWVQADGVEIDRLFGDGMTV